MTLAATGSERLGLGDGLVGRVRPARGDDGQARRAQQVLGLDLVQSLTAGGRFT